jgi:hypothetical protein
VILIVAEGIFNCRWTIVGIFEALIVKKKRNIRPEKW